MLITCNGYLVKMDVKSVHRKIYESNCDKIQI